jgi:hypothetical protein
MTAVNYEVAPIADAALVESVAVAIWRSNPYHDGLRWQQVSVDVREEARVAARVAISTVFQYLIILEATHGEH